MSTAAAGLECRLEGAGRVANYVGGARLGEAKALAQLGKGQFLIVAERDDCFRSGLAGNADGLAELIYEPGRRSIAFFGAGQSREVCQCSGDEVTEAFTGAVSAVHRPIVGRVQATVGSADNATWVRPTSQLKEAIVTIVDDALGEHAEAKNQARLAVTGVLAQRALRVCMLGSAAIDLAWLAHGRTDAAIIFGDKPWDTAAGVILVREAGGSVADAQGQRDKIRSTAAVAASPVLLDEVLDMMP